MPVFILSLVGCKDKQLLLNDPYPETKVSSWYGSFYEPIKTLDPGKAYTSSATVVTGQVYEPPLQYHYLKRPFTLEPLLLTQMPDLRYYDQWRQLLPQNERQDRIAYTTYTLHLKPDVHYAPHPALSKKGDHYRYHAMKQDELATIKSLNDFSVWQSRTVNAHDLAYALKRIADPKVNSPIYALMAEHIVGLRALRKSLDKMPATSAETLRDYPLEGVRVIDDWTLEIWIEGQYPQFIYWLAMPFFAPIPWEVEAFYQQPGMKEKHLSLDWQPLGSGPYFLAEYNPHRIIDLHHNPLFHEERFPINDLNSDQANLKALQGKRLPLIDRLVFSKETESIPRWAKFQQGYYDSSTVTGDSFDQAIQLGPEGRFLLSPALEKKGIILEETVEPSFFYTGFNWLDPVVGGANNQKLRQAIAIALDYDEYIQVFLNGRGQRGLGPIPPGIEGYQSLVTGQKNPIYEQRQGIWQRRSIDQAKRLLQEAGYPHGIDPKTGKPLRLYYDVAMSGPGATAYLAWMRKQFQKIGIDLNIRNTDYNRFQKKMRQGKGQLFAWGWHADYPDPENFLFLFYGPNGKAHFHGENASNYKNSEYDRLFLAMRDAKPYSKERANLLRQMQQQLNNDIPMIVNYYPINLTLLHQWANDIKPMPLTGNFMKYLSLDRFQRQQSILQWNHTSKQLIWWSGGAMLLVLGSVLSIGVQRSRRVMVSRYRVREEQ